MGAYWDCIEHVANVHEGRTEFYKQAEMAAAFCITYAVALMFSMYCACRAIGWHVVARSVVTWISIGTGLLGLAVFAIGVVLQVFAPSRPVATRHSPRVTRQRRVALIVACCAHLPAAGVGGPLARLL